VQHYTPGPDGILLDAYLASLAGANLSPETVSSRRRSLRSMSRVVPLLQLDPGAVSTIGDIRGWADGTRYLYAQNAALFMRWALGAGLVERDPFAGGLRPRAPRYRPRPITDAQLAVLVALPDPVGSWATVAAYAGLRRAEVAQVRHEHLQRTITGWDLVVPRGKGGKADVVPAHERVAAAIGPGSGLVWPARSGEAYTPGALGEKAREAFRAAGVDCTLHQLRHWYATTLYRRSHDVLAVQRAMRHDSIQSTQRYVQADVDWVRAQVSAL
jgi:integrase/recombinase XerD